MVFSLLRINTKATGASQVSRQPWLPRHCVSADLPTEPRHNFFHYIICASNINAKASWMAVNIPCEQKSTASSFHGCDKLKSSLRARRAPRHFRVPPDEAGLLWMQPVLNGVKWRKERVRWFRRVRERSSERRRQPKFLIMQVLIFLQEARVKVGKQKIK